jgi:hypothetical protein
MALLRKTVASLAVLCAAHNAAAAHALAQRYDLPLPLGFYLVAAGAAVAATFILLVLFARRSKAAAVRGAPDRRIAGGPIPGIVVLLQLLSVAALALIVAAGLLGHQGPFKNIVPVTVWVIWWVGFTLLSAFAVNLWPLVSPWAAAFELAERIVRRSTGKDLSVHRRYPAALGAWPACMLFLLFAWFELVAGARDVPRNIAVALAVYSAFTWAGMAVFGREAWNRNVEIFSIVFGLFGRFATLHVENSGHWRWSLHPYATRLLTRTPLSASMIAFTLLILGTVTADGLMETPLWANAVERLLAPAGPAAPDTLTYPALATALLVAVPLALAALYLGAVVLMARLAPGPGVAALAGHFVLSLVPITIAYHLAHYFSLLMVAGQFIIPLASDPFGFGWDLFGTTLYRIDIGIVDARWVWYLSVVAIVTGHVIAVWLAHVTAFAVSDDAVKARRSQ